MRSRHERGGRARHRVLWVAVAETALVAALAAAAQAQDEAPCRYYAHEAVQDRFGVIAPWYAGQNGQCDLRVRIAAETLKRYPWATGSGGVSPAPHYVYSGAWQIAEDGTITIPPIGDWENGDLGQRAAYVISGLVDYYRYSGDPAAIAHLRMTADALLNHCQTGPDHPWPGFLVSVPTKGKAYGQADPHGFIQLDITAEVGLALLRAYEITGNRRWLDAAARWGGLLAAKCSLQPGVPPWGRYANPEDVPWEDHMTGGVAFLLAFLDELIRVGYIGPGGSVLAAREAGIAYVRDTLLPRWTVDDTWGRNYWDWNDPVQAGNVTEFAVRYMMEHPADFPNWRTDCRNVLSLFLNRTSVSPNSNGDVYHGAWAYPESSGCCGRSLWYAPLQLAMEYAQYGEVADSEWAREQARRQAILATYDVHETGVVEDNIDGGQIVAGAWFKIAHPMALKYVLGIMAWQPERFGPGRENHVMRSSAVVRDVTYGDGRVAYETFDAPRDTVDVLRLSFRPTAVRADRKALQRRDDLMANGYVAKPLAGGDWLVTVRHDGRRRVVVEGDDPQQVADAGALAFTGDWVAGRTSAAGAKLAHRFVGNQVRLIGSAGPRGGLADVYLDGEKQLVGLDCWCPAVRQQQVLYYRNGLLPVEHTLEIVARGEGNPLSAGAEVTVEAVQWSDAAGESGFGEGGGPTEAQRWIFGYPERQDYMDAQGHAWQPATEFIVRARDLADVVKESWWTTRQRWQIANTPDPELYRYGVHAPDWMAQFTVGPGTYHVRLKLAETRRLDAAQRGLTVAIGGREVVTGLDIAATAGGYDRAADLVFNGIEPVAGVIRIRFRGSAGGQAIAQAVEVGPGDGGEGATPVTLAAATRQAGNLLANGGFEDGVVGALGRLGETGGGFGWKYVFAGPTQSYLWGESGYDIHPDWGLPEIRTGKEALRTHTEGHGHTIAYQEVAVASQTTYRASVFVHAVDLHGKGFGAQPGDSAGLIIQELDAAGKVVRDHEKVAVTTPCGYTELSATIRTGAATARLRFVLDTVIHSPYNEGHVTYDDCVVEAVVE